MPNNEKGTSKNVETSEKNPIYETNNTHLRFTLEPSMKSSSPDVPTSLCEDIKKQTTNTERTSNGNNN